MLDINLSFEHDIDPPLLTDHQPVEFVCLAPPDARLVLTLDGQTLDPFLRPGEPAWRWRWNPGSAVGAHRAELAALWPDGSATRRAWTLRVATRKLDQDRYEALLEDIQRVAYGLLYTLAGSSGEGAALQREPPWRRSPMEEYYALFEERLDTFERAVERIAARPREQLRPAQASTSLGQAAAISAEALARLPHGDFDTAPAGMADELQAALRSGGGLLPREVPAESATPTTDTYEHRLLKHLLNLLLRRARFIGALAEPEAMRLAASEQASGASSARRARATQIADGAAAAERRLRALRGLPFLAEVRPLPTFRGATPLLQRDPSYREVYRMWMAQRQPSFLAFDSPLFHLPIADLPQLYEIWCALEVARALLALGGTLREQRLIRQPKASDQAPALDFALDLVEQAPLLVIAHGDSTLTLRYQPHYRPERRPTTDHGPRTTDHGPRTTDHGPPTSQPEQQSLNGPPADQLEQQPSVVGRQSSVVGQSASRSSVVGRRSSIVSLDRHTRVPDLAIEIQRPGAPPRVLLLDAKYRLDTDGRSVPQDALADAYTYLGAIGYCGARATIGALLLYPGTGIPEIYPSGVGALPLLPERSETLERILQDALDLSGADDGHEVAG